MIDKRNLRISNLEQTADADVSTNVPRYPDLGRSPEEQIRERAYQLYLQRVQIDGHAERDWLDAELELLANR